ncbi:hypothetical protein Hanom_Chr06g00578561 [Helianthus anomalus]
MYFSRPSPVLSNSSSVRPAHRGWARKLASILLKKSCTDAASLSGSGALFDNDTIKFLICLTNSVAEGCRIRSKKSCHVRVAVEETDASEFSINVT